MPENHTGEKTKVTRVVPKWKQVFITDAPVDFAQGRLWTQRKTGQKTGRGPSRIRTGSESSALVIGYDSAC